MDNQNNQNKNNQGPGNKNNKQGFSFIILVTLITTILVLALYQFRGSAGTQEISYDQFLKYVDDKKVEEVIISSDRITITMKKEKGARTAKQYYTGVVRDDTLAERLDKTGVKFGQEIGRAHV